MKAKKLFPDLSIKRILDRIKILESGGISSGFGSRVIVTVDDNDGEYNVVGLTVNLKIDGKTYSGIVPEDKTVVFSGIQEVGKTTITMVDESQGINQETVINILYYGLYKTGIVFSASYHSWLLTAGYTTEQYPSVSDVLADEKAVRKLMTVHASCDVFVDWYNANNSMFTQFTTNRVAMKWIGLRDYIADKLMAIPNALEQLLASEYWEYILKDKVPKMTSNTAPEGTAFASSEYNADYAAYKAFNGTNINAEDCWCNDGKESNGMIIGYRFIKPIKVQKVIITNRSFSQGNTHTHAPIEFKIQGSNDNVNWETLKECVGTEDFNDVNIYDVYNEKYFMYYRLYITETYSTSNECMIPMLQFYGRSLNESVPIMTSNTTPLGTVSASSVYNDDYNYNAWKAFDGNGNSKWNNNPVTDGTGSWIRYDFETKQVLKVIEVDCMTDGHSCLTEVIADIQVLTEDNSWKTVKTITANTEYTGSIELNNIETKSIRFLQTGGNNGMAIDELYFYSVSYSEEEFGSDGIEMLYDNGVEVVECELVVDATKENDYIHVATTNYGEARYHVDISRYKYIVAEMRANLASTSMGITCESGLYTLINANTNTHDGYHWLSVLDVSQDNTISSRVDVGQIGTQTSANLDIIKVYAIKL